MIPRSMRWRREVVDGNDGYRNDSIGGDEDQWVLGEEEGENMVGFGSDVRSHENGRDERGGRVVSGMGFERAEGVRRASVELEQGFRDSSSEDEVEVRRGRLRQV